MWHWSWGAVWLLEKGPFSRKKEACKLGERSFYKGMISGILERWPLRSDEASEPKFSWLWKICTYISL